MDTKTKNNRDTRIFPMSLPSSYGKWLPIFFDWGTGCHMIAQEFVTWSRGIKTAVIEKSKKTITFLNTSGYDYSKVYDQQLLYGSQMQAVYLSYPHVEMEEEFAKWIKDIDLFSFFLIHHKTIICWQVAFLFI